MNFNASFAPQTKKITQAKGVVLGEKEKAITGNKKIMKWKISSVKVNIQKDIIHTQS